MSSVEKVNRELSRLDSELRAGTIDRATFRSRRRQLLLDFEERQATTTPGATTGNETTLVDPPTDLPLYLPPLPPAPEPEPAEQPQAGRRSPMGLVAIALGAVVVLAIGAWWMFGRQAPTGTAMPAASAAPAAAAPIAGPEMPQEVAAALLETEWTDADVAEFLQRWARLSPETIQAAAEDSRIWLLRGETDRRLREARERESVEHSAEMVVRVQQLEQVQAAIRTP